MKIDSTRGSQRNQFLASLERPSARPLRCIEIECIGPTHNAMQELLSMTEATPFIADQTLYRLQATPEERRAWLLKGKFRLLADDGESGEATVSADKSGWYRQSRLGVMLDSSVQYLCVLDDAGMGKSIAVQQIQYLRQCAAFRREPEFSDWHGHVAVKIEFADLWAEEIESAEQLLREPQRGAGREPYLVTLFATQASIHGSHDVIWRLLHRKATMGEMTLIVDALDQIPASNQTGNTVHKARILGRLLAHYPNLKCVVAGRPFAVNNLWNELFACIPRGIHADATDWQFVQLGGFTDDQRTLYLGPKRSQLVQRVDANELRTPRSLDFLNRIPESPPELLAAIRTKADIYWQAVQYQMAASVEKQPILPDLERAYFLLSLIAFEMFRGGNTDRLILDNPGKQKLFEWIKPRIDQVCQHLGFFRIPDTFDPILKQLNIVFRLNCLMEPGMLKIPDHTNPDQPDISEIRFESPTVSAFFAALWITRYASADDHVCLLSQNQIYGREDSADPHPRGGVLYELWRFAVEMPGEASGALQSFRVSAARVDRTYVRAMALLFDHADQTRRRPTEMIWHAWPRLLGLAESDLPHDPTEADVDRVTWRLAKHVHQAVEASNSLQFDDSMVPEAARQLLWDFLREFRGICGEDTDRGRVARTLLCHGDSVEVQNAYRGPNEPRYVLCPPAGTTSTFVMGSPDGTFIPPGASAPWPVEEDRWNSEHPHVETLTPAQSFWLRDFVVTNAELELFLPSHQTDRSKFSKSDDHPAVNVSWYEAMLFCRWLGAGFRLPTEREWECACRAIEKFDPQVAQPRYWYGDDASHELMNYGRRQKGTTVRGMFPQPNAWGLYDMLGNVWEWCSDLYRYDLRAAEGVDPASDNAQSSGGYRVLRGGSWYGDPHSARCAVRNRDAPDFRSSGIGFRLSRTL